MLKFTFFAVNPQRYEQLENRNCLGNTNIHSVTSDGTSDHSNCFRRCDENNNCGGFTFGTNTCFFKGQTCRSDLSDRNGVTLFVKQGCKLFNVISNLMLMYYRIRCVKRPKELCETTTVVIGTGIENYILATYILDHILHWK